jgi:hypothetical protein
LQSTSLFETSAKDKDFTVKIIDAFDDAKKRVTLRNPAIAPEDQTGYSVLSTLFPAWLAVS